MSELPRRKVGIIACSGEELPEGTVTRQAARKVLEYLRPADTVTICLPLFLAGDEGERAFARLHPTITVDGCPKRCAARATEMYSARPAASVVVSDLVAMRNMEPPAGRRRLDHAGQQAVEATAKRVVELVDEVLGAGSGLGLAPATEPGLRPAGAEVPGGESVQAPGACGWSIPVQNVIISGRPVRVAGLPLIFKQLEASGRAPCDEAARELLELVKVYNHIPASAETSYREALLREYGTYREKEGQAGE